MDKVKEFPSSGAGWNPEDYLLRQGPVPHSDSSRARAPSLLRRPLLACLLLRRQLLGALPSTTLAACSRPRLPLTEAHAVGCSQPCPTAPLMVSSTFTLINLRQSIVQGSPNLGMEN